MATPSALNPSDQIYFWRFRRMLPGMQAWRFREWPPFELLACRVASRDVLHQA
ncbi:hypothetical protein GGTG_07416 [Gaeumannomyces tritici R3-111a-1]|uniref:Uncharacterized protein n=1 Tax=Gaeumannomyces tritici (strain R3-111a-1) TaxID=644352 RepID=J3P1L8_GAET3|nr:hypothetical protein GGTG_07416 [Gaeumannomyces tritici R3-111a-1]EJT73560.1 hypothetical protein GGTG_07416 [Gaeumannomyces tritici R3-111a-1]